MSPLLVHKAIGNGLLQLGWQPGVRLGRTNPPHIRIESIDFVKDGVGIEIEMGKASLVESHIFARFPRFVQANIIQSAVALVPMKSLSRQMTAGLWPFEWLKDGLQEMRPWPLKYKLTVIGFSMSETSIEVIEATSELDRFLIDAIGMSVEEMVLMNERLDYDFKVRLPTPEKLAQEVCGFANLRGGGHILLGIDNGGRLVGLPRGEGLDDIRLRMTNVICDCCSPKPMFEFFTFDNPEDATTAILIMRVHEAERKPCMVQHRVYVRSGPSVRPADADEIRRLVLG